MTPTDTLDKAVTDAVNETPVPETPPESLEVPDEVPETEEAEEGEEEEVKEDDLADEDLTNAKNLYKALKNPQSAQAVIRAMAEQAGILKTTQDVNQARDVVLEVLQESLGTEFNFLAPKLSSAIKRILEMERAGYKQALQQESQQRVQVQLAQEIESTLGKLRRETKGESKLLESRMTELMDELPIGKGISTERYLRHLYKVANAENIQKSAKRSVAAKINQNANDAGSRLSSGGAKGSGAPVKPTEGKMSLEQSIQYALDSMNAK